MGITINMKANDLLLKRLKELNIHQHSGKIHKDSFLQIGLDFSPVKILAPQILNGPHFKDWIRSKGWPEGYIPLAIYSPDNEEQEEIFMNASSSEAEEFFVIKQDDKNYPVFMWSHSAGLDKWAESIEVFIAELG
ncbi:MAG: hypothetical protein JKY03_12155 [Aureispira sp.]|nr:hypothetical protein [Aureispira sp.]